MCDVLASIAEFTAKLFLIGVMLNVQTLLAQIFILDRRFLQLWFFLRLGSYIDGSYWIEICGEVYIRCMFQISICFNFSPTPTKFYQLHNQPIPMFQSTLHIWGKPNNSPTITPIFFCILVNQCFILDRRYVMGKYFLLFGWFNIFLSCRMLNLIMQGSRTWRYYLFSFSFAGKQYGT